MQLKSYSIIGFQSYFPNTTGFANHKYEHAALFLQHKWISIHFPYINGFQSYFPTLMDFNPFQSINFHSKFNNAV